MRSLSLAGCRALAYTCSASVDLTPRRRPLQLTPADIDIDYCNVCDVAVAVVVDADAGATRLSLTLSLSVALTSKDLNGSKSAACCAGVVAVAAAVWK